jgi:hypothetical protein
MRPLLKHFSESSALRWATLFPVTYLLHIAEEYYCGGGFPQYMREYYQLNLTETRFLILQLIGVVGMIVGLWLSVKLRFPKTMLVILAAAVLKNGAIHLIRSAANARYEPGLITGAAIWIPLGLTTIYFNRAEMSSIRLIFSIATGLGISGLVELIQVL